MLRPLHPEPTVCCHCSCALLVSPHFSGSAVAHLLQHRAWKRQWWSTAAKGMSHKMHIPSPPPQSQTLRMSECHLRMCTPHAWTEPWVCWWFGLNSRDTSQLSPLSCGQMRNIQAPDYSKLEGSTYSSFLLSKTRSLTLPHRANALWNQLRLLPRHSDTVFTSTVWSFYINKINLSNNMEWSHLTPMSRELLTND